MWIFFPNYSGFFPSRWITSINFNFSWQPLTAKTKDLFSSLLRQIGQECCCHLQTQDYICLPTNTHTQIHNVNTRGLEWKLNDLMCLWLPAEAFGMQSKHTAKHGSRLYLVFLCSPVVAALCSLAGSIKGSEPSSNIFTQNYPKAESFLRSTPNQNPAGGETVRKFPQ